MTSGNNDNPQPEIPSLDLRRIPPWVLVLLLSIGSGGSGTYLVNKYAPPPESMSDPRPDPFTGKDAREMKREILQEIHRTETRLMRDIDDLNAETTRLNELIHRWHLPNSGR